VDKNQWADRVEGQPERALPDDARRAVAYLVAPESDEYIAIMRVLEAAATDLTPDEVTARLRDNDVTIQSRVVETRLAQLREWSAVSARSDQTHVRRVQELLLRNFRYTATRPGRQVQRFYETVLAGTPVMREIPLQSLSAVVSALETLAAPSAPWGDLVWVRARVNESFTSHDDLDSSLVGAEDTLMGLADRFDLDDDRTGELKRLLVGYATRVAVELEKGADRAAIALTSLTGRFAELAELTVAGSAASDLIGRDLLAASKGGFVRDWEGLASWFDPFTGRSAKFQARMVAAIPTFYTNLRRLHTSGESGTSRARALVLARACLDPEHGTSVFLSAVGDHPWRKLHGETDDPGAGRTPPWRDGPQAALPPGLRAHGKAGVRGRAAKPLDDTATRAVVERARAERLAVHRERLQEILAVAPGTTLSHGAASVAAAVLLDAVRQPARDGHRRAVRDGLGCTVFWTGEAAGALRSPSWRIWLPGRDFLFHVPAARPHAPDRRADEPVGAVDMRVRSVVA
jgi:uncharacterized protein (TIGR02677 family)